MSILFILCAVCSHQKKVHELYMDKNIVRFINRSSLFLFFVLCFTSCKIFNSTKRKCLKKNERKIELNSCVLIDSNLLQPFKSFLESFPKFIHYKEAKSIPIIRIRFDREKENSYIRFAASIDHEILDLNKLDGTSMLFIYSGHKIIVETLIDDWNGRCDDCIKNNQNIFKRLPTKNTLTYYTKKSFCSSYFTESIYTDEYIETYLINGGGFVFKDAIIDQLSKYPIFR